MDIERQKEIRNKERVKKEIEKIRQRIKKDSPNLDPKPKPNPNPSR